MYMYNAMQCNVMQYNTKQYIIIWQGILKVNPSVLIGSFLVGISP